MVFIRAATHKTSLVEFIQIVEDGEAVDTQVHCDFTQAQTSGMLSQDFKNFVFHGCYLSFFCTLIIAQPSEFVKPNFSIRLGNFLGELGVNHNTDKAVIHFKVFLIHFNELCSHSAFTTDCCRH